MSFENPFSRPPQENIEKKLEEKKFEEEKNKEIPIIPVLDRELIKIGTETPERKAEFVNEKKNLPPEAIIDLYHGLNGGLDTAMNVLDSPDHGVRQISGPCLSLYPVGQFWKPGDAGFHYSIPRKLIEFPGESNPDAKLRVDNGGSASLIDIAALPVGEFNGEVMRTERKVDVYEEQLVDGFLEEVPVGEKVVELTEKEQEEVVKIAKKIAELKSIAATEKNISSLSK